MCGIVGLFSKRNEVVPILVDGLKKLEYRGYDSSGLAVVSPTGVLSLKSVGRISQLEEKLVQIKLPEGVKVGIAHTRWATHGVPSETNAHPHASMDQKIWVVHNGIIENYKESKDFLEKQGTVFVSQTDTEVIPHLIRYHYQGDLKKAVIKALTQLRGAFAIAVISADEPNRLLGAKHGSPLVVGLGADEIILASDVSAIVSRTRRVVYLADGDLIDIQDGRYSLEDLTEKTLDKPIENVDWDLEAINKGGYDHFLLKEIMEQPKAIVDSCRGRLIKELGAIKFGGLMDIESRLAQVERVICLGVGSTYYACQLTAMYFEDLVRVPAKAELSPEFRYKNPYLDEHTWVVAMSQSGETADTIAGIYEAQKHRALVTGIVNVVGSTISRITEAGVYNHIGPEISVASTKNVISQIVIGLMHALLLGRLKGTVSQIQVKNLISEVENLPSQIEKVLSQRDKIKSLAERYAHYQNFLYIGRKYNYPIALEGALKLKELSYIHAEGLSSGEMKHGFIALVDESLPTISICTQDSVHSKQLSNMEEIKARKGKIIAIANQGDNKVQAISDEVIFVPLVNEILAPIVNLIPLQLFAYYVSVFRGLDVDKPRNLAKSVTVE